MNIEIKVPQTIKDCSPQQLSKWLFLCSGQNDLSTLMGKLDFRVEVVSIFSGLSKTKLYNVSARDIHVPFNHLIDLLSYEPTEPSGVVCLEGVKYVFNKTFEHNPTGQIIDLKLIESVYDDPIQVMSILYVEDGMTYNQSDENDRILNPSSVRKEVMSREFPGDEFLNVFAFFLHRFESLRVATTILNLSIARATMEMSRAEMMEEIDKYRNGMNGLRTSTHSQRE